MTDDLRNRVAAAIWDVYQKSPTVSDGAAGMSWDWLSKLADDRPGTSAAVIRDTALAEADAAIEVVKLTLIERLAAVERLRGDV